MFEHRKIQSLDDYFVELNKRAGQTVHFYRIVSYSNDINSFLNKYYQEARTHGVVIDGGIANPTEQNLSYYNEIMGMDFRLDPNFIKQSLHKWLPRMNSTQLEYVSSSIFTSLENMSKIGKTEAMLKNAYIKFMCWLYYKFERIVNILGDNKVPKILYEGRINKYELSLISILSNAGADVVLLEVSGDTEYLKIDANSEYSNILVMTNTVDFPKDYSIKNIISNIQKDAAKEQLYGGPISFENCTNAWKTTPKCLDELMVGLMLRGKDPRFFYNCFCRINGVEDKTIYEHTLIEVQRNLQNTNRKYVIEDKGILNPTPEEISKIHHGNYQNEEQLILDLTKNITFISNVDLLKIIKKSFIDAIHKESLVPGININKLKNKAIFILCALKRYSSVLFKDWKFPEVSCFIFLGGCKNSNEALFMSFLARLPIDVVILAPNLNHKCCLSDDLLLEENYQESMELSKFPDISKQTSIGTAAFHAERELDTLLYEDTGLYRTRQYQKANSIVLRTMYEEIKILWNTELKFRPGFSVSDNKVIMPVIYAKISGIKGNDLSKYWDDIRELINNDIMVIKDIPCLTDKEENPIKPYVVSFYKNGKLLHSAIKSHAAYKYGFLRDEVQDYLLEKLEFMIKEKMIKGIGENGTEYTVISVALNLPKHILQKIQQFDFTKSNPKIVYISVSENTLSLEDSIFVTYLNLLGFDILFFVPTGYKTVEKYMNISQMEEHQIGDYRYDLSVPDLSSNSFCDRLFSLFRL